jgi:hypothetical protein
MLVLDLLRALNNRHAVPISTRLRTSGLLRRLGVDELTREEQDRAIRPMLDLLYPLAILQVSTFKAGEQEGLKALFERGGEEGVCGYVRGRVWNFDAAVNAAIEEFESIPELLDLHRPDADTRSG